MRLNKKSKIFKKESIYFQEIEIAKINDGLILLEKSNIISKKINDNLNSNK